MNKNLPATLLVCFLFGIIPSLSAQVAVVSANGYTANVVVIPRQIIPSSSSCQYGYNYNVRLDFNVSFTGNNQPSSLFTLQGVLGCGSSTHFFDLPNGQASGSVTSVSNVWRSLSDCNTANVTSLGCNQVTLEIEGPGISRRFINFAVTPSPLPVKLVDFSVKQTDNRVQINWSTATEENSAYFLVERKTATNDNWVEVARVAAKGNTTDLSFYSQYDDNPGTGYLQYRLVMVDADGKKTYSEVRLINIKGENNKIGIYPVPFTGDQLHFTGLLSNPTAYTVRIVDVAGAVLYDQPLQSTVITLPTLRQGMYLVQVTNRLSGDTQTLRLIR